MSPEQAIAQGAQWDDTHPAIVLALATVTAEGADGREMLDVFVDPTPKERERVLELARGYVASGLFKPPAGPWRWGLVEIPR